MTRNQELLDQAEAVLVANYRPLPITLVRGEGCHLFDADGARYLDLMGGIATAALGHCHPKVTAALEEQARKLWHVSNLFGSEPKIRLAEQLVANCFADRVFFCNSGAEANEAALKCARRFHAERGDPRPEFVAFDGSFHGRTLFTVSATGQPAYWKGFEPVVSGFRFAPFGDLDAVREQVSERTAAILVEPVQGESGVWPAPPGFLAGLREIADASGALLIFDEVQCGMGRMGTLFAHEHEGVSPDLMTLAKALGNGIPIGALCATEACAEILVPGSHASTFGGNPLACAAASAVMTELVEGGVLEQSRQAGAHLEAKLDALAASLGNRVVEVRGRGLLRAIECAGPVAAVIEGCLRAGVLVISAGESVVRLAPPLIIGEAEIDTGIGVLEGAIREALG
jgi:predicted acetylornithine/succinylornithine family transaminase